MPENLTLNNGKNLQTTLAVKETIGCLVVPRISVKPRHTVEKVGKIFLKNHDLHSLPVVDEGTPVGIVHRYQLMDIFLIPYGRDLHGRKEISYFMDPNPIIVEENLPIERASQYITEVMYLPVAQDFIITQNGAYKGMGTVLDLLRKITALQIHNLKEENMRLAAEVEITQRLQQMLLPTEQELDDMDGLEIAGFMEPAEEVGGDYYDVFKHKNNIKIGIGDVTGHGLESGVLMIMAQTAVRTLQLHNEKDPVKFLNTLNQVIYGNVQRINADKSMTLSLLDYANGNLKVTGQHEEVIVVRAGGHIEKIDTIDLGFPIALEEDITAFIAELELQLNVHDVAILYTDGITEAENEKNEQYGIGKLCEVVKYHWQSSAQEIKQLIINDLKNFIGKQKIFDDITLLVIKRKMV